MNEKSIYQQQLLDHYHHPYHREKLDNATISSGVYNPSCGDSVVMQALLENDTLKKVAFEGKGCVISQATASMLCKESEGRSMSEILALKPDDIKKMIGIEVGPTRLRCALLPLEALQQAILAYQKETRA